MQTSNCNLTIVLTVHVNDTLIFDIYLDDGCFDEHFDSMSCWLIPCLIALIMNQTLRILEYLDLSFKEEGHMERHHFEDQFVTLLKEISPCAPL